MNKLTAKVVICLRLFRLISCLLVVGMLNSATSWAQGFVIYNSADISQPWITNINPAIISSQFSRVSLGLKIFQLGFLQNQSFEIRESHLNASFPFYFPMDIGVGCDLRHFSAGIYSELSASLMLSRRILNNLSFGIKIGLERHDFAKQDFNLVDMNDPLLNGNLTKTSLNLGLGAFWNPDRWSAGIGIDHLNRPDIGRQTNATLPREISASVGYNFGWFTPAFLLHHDGHFARFGLAVTANHSRYGTFRFAFEKNMPIKVEFQFNLSRDNSLQYGLDLPSKELGSASLGSHELVYNLIIDRGPEMGQPQLHISKNEMQILEETIVRIMSPSLKLRQLENIDELLPEYLKANGNFRNLLVIPTGALNKYETETIRRQRYAKLSEEIKEKLQRNPELNLILHANDQSFADAKILKQYLLRDGIKETHIAKINSSSKVKLEGFESGRQLKTQKNPSCSLDKLTITLDLSGKVRRIKEWLLIIKNDKNEVIKAYKGKDRLPDQMEWDWKNEKGDVVTPGQYSCALIVKSMSGIIKSSWSVPINISRLNRTVYLRFTQESKLQANRIKP